MADLILTAQFVGIALFFPFALLYCIQMNVIRRNSCFHTPFYGFFIIRGLTMFGYEATEFYGRNFLIFGMFVELYKLLPNYALNFYFFFVYFFYVESLVVIFMLLNRLTGIALPIQQRKIWKFGFPFALAIIFLLPIPFCTFLFTSIDTYLGTQTESGTNITTYKILYKIKPNEEDAILRLIRENLIFNVIFVTICLALNLLTLLAYRAHKKATLQSIGSAEWRVQWKLTIYTVATFFFHFIFAVFQFGTNFFLYIGLTSIGMFFGFSSEVVYIFCVLTLPSLLILWASTMMRKKTLAQIKWIAAFGKMGCLNTNNNRVRNAQNVQSTRAQMPLPDLQLPQIEMVQMTNAEEGRAHLMYCA